MRSTPPSPRSRRVSRRHFLTGTTAGLAASLVVPSTGLTAAQRRGGGGGRGEGPPLPPIQPPPAQFPGTGKYLYVTNDRGRRVDVFANTTGQHSLLWSFPYAEPGGRVGGVCAQLEAVESTSIAETPHAMRVRRAESRGILASLRRTQAGIYLPERHRTA